MTLSFNSLISEMPLLSSHIRGLLCIHLRTEDLVKGLRDILSFLLLLGLGEPSFGSSLFSTIIKLTLDLLVHPLRDESLSLRQDLTSTVLQCRDHRGKLLAYLVLKILELVETLCYFTNDRLDVRHCLIELRLETRLKTLTNTCESGYQHLLLWRVWLTSTTWTFQTSKRII